MILISIIGVIANIGFILVLIMGLYLCRKFTFTEGYYFFLMMIVSFIISYSYPIYINTYFDSIVESINNVMTIGQFLALTSTIGLIFKAVAFFILVIGILRKWKGKKDHKKTTIDV